MRLFSTAIFAAFLTACDSSTSKPAVAKAPEVRLVEAVDVPAPVEIKSSVVRINSTQQSWNPGQPWEKNPPSQRRALAAIVGVKRVLTTSEMVADATYLEFESPDGNRFAQAKVIAVDYEANLALLGPADESEGAKFFSDTVPLKIASPPSIGTSLDVLQVEDNGLAIITPGNLRSVDVSSNFLVGHSFLTYLVKASLQSAESSFSLPVLKDGNLVGILISYNSDDQICEVSATDIVTRFLDETNDDTYEGFPSLGIAVARTEDNSFRQFLKLGDDQGGVYVRTVRKGGAAEKAGIKIGDVVLSVDGKTIDRRGYYQHERYGNLFWGHLVRGAKAAGDVIGISILRAGEVKEIEAVLTREEEGTKLIPEQTFGRAPNFAIKGGLVFQELSRSLLEAFGKGWESRAPLNFLDALQNPEKYEDRMDRVIFLSGSIPTPATVGYESLHNLIVKKVNGKEVRNMKGLIAAFEENSEPLHAIEFDEEDFKVFLDEALATTVDSQLLQRGINRLSRAE